MRILVIGCDRGLGKAVVEKYGREGHFVMAVGINIPHRIPLGKIVFRRADIERISSIEKTMGSLTYDIIIDSTGFEKMETWRKKLEFFKRRCCRYILLYPCGEVLERVLREEFAEGSGCSYTAVSPCIIYGKGIIPFVPCETPELTDDLLSRILDGKPIVVSDEWEKKFPIMNEQDFADAIYRILQEDESKNSFYYIIGQESVSPLEVLSMIADLWGIDIKTLHLPVSLSEQSGHSAAFPFWVPVVQTENGIMSRENFRSFRESLPEILDSYLISLSHGFLGDREREMDRIALRLEEAEGQEAVRVILCKKNTECPVFGKLYKLFLRKSFDCDRNEKKFHILAEWIGLKQQGISFGSFFRSKGIRSVAIYGMGEIGLLLYHELQKERPGLVSYVIDRGGHGAMDSTPVFYYCAPNLPKVDAVVVTPVLLKKSEMDEIARPTYGVIFTIEDVLAEIKADSLQKTIGKK